MTDTLEVPTGAEMDSFIQHDLLSGDVPGDEFGHPNANWCGDRAESQSEKDEANGRAIRLCELLRERKGWLFHIDSTDIGSWAVSVEGSGLPSVRESFPRAVCEAACRAWMREEAR